MNRIGSLFVLFFVTFLLCSCGSDESIEGKWRKTAGVGTSQQSKQFFDDGRCIWTLEDEDGGEILIGEYSFSGDSLLEIFDPSVYEIDTIEWKVEFYDSELMVLTSARLALQFELVK
ncbi:MAG: hypothetical protein JNM49_09420 [Flavobacteriales bacterium]|nr:hypothetical protein [Flavobacteriales bacterium]